MVNPSPVDLHSAYTDVSALLTVLSDPAKHKARLDELVAQEQAAKDQIAALNDMAADTRRLHSTAQATNIVSENRKAALDAREGEIGERAKQVDLVLQREAALTVREKSAKREAERLAAMRADLEVKLEKMKTLTATLEG